MLWLICTFIFQTMGVTEPPPMLKVSVETVPCDMDESDDYVLISVVEDDKKEPENPSPKELSISSTQKPSKSPILRSKSSPNKPKKEVQSRDEDDDEYSSLTRSYSGPMIRRSQRPRSNAMVENRLSTRSVIRQNCLCECHIKAISNNFAGFNIFC